jgi:predicted PurR-regulated permease PerM
VNNKSAGDSPDPPEPAQATDDDAGTEDDQGAVGGPSYLGRPGPPVDHRAPFYMGFVGASGAILAYWLLTNIAAISSTLILIVVSLFLAAGLNPAVSFFERRGLKRTYAVIVVIACVIVAVALFLVAIVPVITEQVASLTDKAPDWFDQLQHNGLVRDLDREYDVIDKARDYVTGGDFVGTLFGGALGVGLAVLGALFNTFIVLVLTLYFLSSLDTTKKALYRLAPASRRDRVSRLGDRIIDSVGGYVSGAFIVAMCAGISSLIFLFAVGLGEYAVALAFVVALLDVIPMIGATIGAIVVTAIAFAEDPKIGIACVIFYVIYQQLENYVIYPRVMSKSVDVPGAVTVIAALIGAALLGVVGALLAIPTAAAILMLTREVFVRQQDDR